MFNIDPELKDMLGNNINIFNVVAYGRSNRNNPINIGVVVGFRDVENPTESYSYDIIITGMGNKKHAYIPSFHSKRLIVLPNEYLRGVEIEY